MQKNMEGFVKNSLAVEEKIMEGGAGIRWLITHKDGAPTFSMRLININKGKSTPFHSHNYEHEIYIIEGEAEATIGQQKHHASAGDFIFIPPNVYHGMKAIKDVKLICIVPLSAAREILGD